MDVYSALHSPTQFPHPRKLSRWGGRAVVVLIGIRLGIDGVKPIYYETIKVCDSLHLFSRGFDLTSMNMKVLHILPQSVGIAGGRPLSSFYFVGSQADNLFYLDPHHTRATVPLRPPTQTQTQTTECERERGIPIRQASSERGFVASTSQPPSFPNASRVKPHRLFYILIPNSLAITTTEATVASSSSSGGAYARWNSAGANANGSVLSGEAASDAGWMRRRCITCHRIALRS